MKYETGRSMVEMLGVLAIIGVLSAGGVYGYGVAMKKHKANELLHQASMLATTISAQIDSLGGDLPETITDFGSTNYGKFSTSVTQTEDKKKFVLTIENVDSSVCDQLKKGGMVQGVECNPEAKTAKITYYKNLATNDEEGKNSPTGGNGGGSGGETEPSCTLTETDCPAGVDVENCVCESSEGQTCDDHTTNQCGLGYFCRFSPSNCGDSDRGNGVCTAISGGTQKGGHWVGPELDWWSANSWCIGKGSTGLITYSTLQSAYSCNKSSYSCNLSALNADGLSDYYWSAEDYGNSCTAWFVDVLAEVFNDNLVRNSGIFALCE